MYYDLVRILHRLFLHARASQQTSNFVLVIITLAVTYTSPVDF